jgi:hypothetical protein
MVPEEHPEAAMQRLGALVRDAVPGEVPTRDHVAARVRLVETLEAERGSRARRGLWAGLALVCTAASIVLVVFLMRDKPMTWTVDGVAQSGYVSAEKDARIQFSDGSEVVMEKGTRGRVADVGAKKARLVVEDGRARVHVKHRPNLSFMIDCGPYGVEVTGTRFDVAWKSEVLEVRVSEGSVAVRGPHVNEVRVNEGQMLRVKAGKVELGADLPEQPPAPSGTEPLPPPTASIAPPPPAPVTPKTTWAQRVAAGEFDVVLREASERGVDSVLQGGSLQDVAALADAARYKGRSDIAKKALLAERSRFVTSREGRAAAFLLGRMAEEQERSPAAAIQWYDRYLSESPGGPFAGDALGRKMVLVSKTSGNAAAAPLAREYLKRFPSGAYASAARAIADAP